MDERSKLPFLAIAGVAVLFVLAIAAQKCERDREHEQQVEALYYRSPRGELTIGPEHYGLQSCLDRAKEPLSNLDILFHYEDSCAFKYDAAAADTKFSSEARKAFARLRDRERTLAKQLREFSPDHSEEDLALLARPRLRAAYDLDRFMPEIQRLAPSDWHPEAAPTGPVTPIR